MCTAINDKNLFGRTLDLEYSYKESVTVCPRNKELELRYLGKLSEHLAMIGAAHVSCDYPLYYDGINEAGLAIAALSFPKFAKYKKAKRGYLNLCSFELIPYILGTCESVNETVAVLEKINIVDDSFSAHLQATPMHWLIADSHSCICVEPRDWGLDIQENPYGVMTNSPPFDFHKENISIYSNIDSTPNTCALCDNRDISPCFFGSGTVGLPGDYTSPSRFVRAVYAKSHTDKSEDKHSNITSFFHIMDTVSIPLGAVRRKDGSPIRTVYTSCADLSESVYYFTTYSCRQISAVPLHAHHLNGNTLTSYPMARDEDIYYLNKIKESTAVQV